MFSNLFFIRSLYSSLFFPSFLACEMIPNFNYLWAVFFIAWLILLFRNPLYHPSVGVFVMLSTDLIPKFMGFQGLQRQTSAFDLLQSIEYFFNYFGASCKSNDSAFSVDVSLVCSLFLSSVVSNCKLIDTLFCTGKFIWESVWYYIEDWCQNAWWNFYFPAYEWSIWECKLFK